jgi:hypothetical protein
MAWLGHVPGLVSTEPMALTIDGYQGQWIDLDRDHEGTPNCERLEYLVSSGIYCADGSPTVEPGTVGLFPGERARLILLDLRAGDLLGIAVFSMDAARFDALWGEAIPILESFKFK